METCPACGYKEPVQNNQYKGHIMGKYKNKDTGKLGMFNSDETVITIPAGEGRVAGVWNKVTDVPNVTDTAPATPPSLPKQEVPIAPAPKIPIPTNI